MASIMLGRTSARLFRGTGKLSVSRQLSTGSAMKAQFAIQDAEDFKSKVLDSKKPVVVNFRASWCGPCKMLTPRLEVAVDARGDKFDLAKVDIDQQADLAMQYEVRMIELAAACRLRTASHLRL
ncbi:unnamed protein product, partial [Ixodes pacificus]